MKEKYTIGVDFGTDSVRVLIADAFNGNVIADSLSLYGRWGMGKYCDPKRNQFRQHPLDYIESLKLAMGDALAKVPDPVIRGITAISIATTGSTPVAINRDGIPLAMVDGFEDNPNAMFLLWKDHTAIEEAEEINNLSHSGNGIDFTKYIG